MCFMLYDRDMLGDRLMHYWEGWFGKGDCSSAVPPGGGKRLIIKVILNARAHTDHWIQIKGPTADVCTAAAL